MGFRYMFWGDVTILYTENINTRYISLFTMLFVKIYMIYDRKYIDLQQNIYNLLNNVYIDYKLQENDY